MPYDQVEGIEGLPIPFGLERVRLLARPARPRLAITYSAQFPAGPAPLTPPSTYLATTPFRHRGIDRPAVRKSGVRPRPRHLGCRAWRRGR